MLQTAVGDHLDRTQMMLVELANAETDGADVLALEHQRAEDLVAANRVIRQSALQSGDGQVVDILEDLERVLLEIANAPANATSNDLTDLQSRITREDLLFRLRVIASEMRQRNMHGSRDWRFEPAADAEVVGRRTLYRPAGLTEPVGLIRRTKMSVVKNAGRALMIGAILSLPALSVAQVPPVPRRAPRPVPMVAPMLPGSPELLELPLMPVIPDDAGASRLRSGNCRRHGRDARDRADDAACR